MEVRLTLVDPSRSALTVDVAVRCETGTGLDRLRPALLEAVGRDPAADLGLYVDGDLVPGTHVLGDPPLLEGVVLSVGRPGGPAGRLSGAVGGFLELHVVGGPDAGQVYRLTPGRHRIGRGAEAVVTLEDPDVSRVHAELVVAPSGLTVADAGSTNGTWVDGVDVGATGAVVTERSRIVLGGSTLKLRVPDAEPAATTLEDGLLLVNRLPRMVPPVRPVEVRLPVPPPDRRTPRVPLVAVAVPLVVAVPLAIVLGSPFYLVIGLMSPLMLLGNLVSDRVTGRRDHRAARAAYGEARARSDAEVDAAVATEELRRRAGNPDAAELLRIGTGVLERVWERGPRDEDWLTLRVGTAALPSRIRVLDPQAAPGEPPGVPFVHDVPVTVPLARVGVLGVAGHRPRVAALARYLVGQVAVLHSPRDVRVVVLVADAGGRPAPGGAAQEWGWVGWLPHARPGGDLDTTASALLGVGADQVRRRVAELTALVDRRTTAAPGAPGPTGGHVVVVLDGAQALRSVPGVARLLSAGPAVGVHLVCLDRDPAQLPVECGATVVVSGEVATRVRVAVAGELGVDDATADLVSDRWAVRLAHGLAPLRDATPDLDAGSLPTSVRLLDLLDVDATSADAVADAWRRRPRTTATPLGLTASGRLATDLRVDGPHVLVAGTTGAGKSELLQTLVAGLAVGNRPDELAFVLVDYKGGAAFAECAQLPHVVGLVTDLDGSLTSRALESLSAEVSRRERVLAAAGAADFDAYLALEETGGGTPRLARLVLVVDEFRVLAEELPDFLSGLVRLAAVGRSLGLHLVLATQRPAGVVSADITANVNLRIALRLQDAGDSLGVVDAPDAARISDRTPGRAVARVGSHPLVEVQVARVSGGPVVAAEIETEVLRLSAATLGDPLPRSAGGAEGPAGVTDLRRLVTAVSAAAQQLGVRPVASPWLPPLPDVVTVAALAALAGAEPDPPPRGTARPDYGLLDDPAGQRRRVARWDLAADGPLVVAGTARSGRTGVVRALVASLAEQVGPDEAWVYAVDGSGGLADLAVLPHVGAVVDTADTERSLRLLTRLVAEIDSRQTLLGTSGAADLAELRSGPGAAPPWVLVAVDGWEAVGQAWDDADGQRCTDLLHQLLREGPRVGVLVVVTGGRSVLTGQLGAAVPQRLVLRLADAADVVLAGIPAREAPSRWPAGRGLLVGGPAGERTRQVQVALLDADPSGAAQRAALEALTLRVTSAAGVPATGLPPAVPAMPTDVALSTVSVQGAGTWPVGLGGPDVGGLGLDPDADGPVLLVAGHPGSGRSTALLTMAHGALLRTGRPVVVVAPRRSPLRDLAGTIGVLLVADGRDAAVLTDALDRAREIGSGAVVLVDDVEALDGTPAEQVLLPLLGAPGAGEVVVLAGSTPELLTRFGGVAALARRAAAGVLLGPAGPLDGDVFSVRLPRRSQRTPGRGFVVRAGHAVAVQVARPDTSLPTRPVTHPEETP